jgi:hypothetical protein
VCPDFKAARAIKDAAPDLVSAGWLPQDAKSLSGELLETLLRQKGGEQMI